MIKSFGDKTTRDLFHGIASSRTRRFPIQIFEITLIKLDMLNAARSISDLKSPPGNKLEQLKGDLAGFYSIRINNKWRIIFNWIGSHAFNVLVTDYH